MIATACRRAVIGACLVIHSVPLLAQQPGQTADAEEEEESVEDIVVQATRSGRRVKDEPIRVEVLNRAEIEEKITMRPGNIAMVVAETGGLRVQVTAPSLGASNIRIYGMDGRYTQLLADGLPLHGGSTSSLGLLQIPPTDLGQVEVIKGSASALYGAAALGGVINLVSRRPGDGFEAEALANATTRDGQDLTGYAAGPIGGGWSASLTGGLHRQSKVDLDGDGWVDIPGYDRWLARPRLFWDGDDGGASLFVTVGALSERRSGGTLPGRTVPDGQPFPEGQQTDRIDAGIVAEAPIGGDLTGHLRASWTRQDHRRRFGPVLEIDRHRSALAETSISGRSGGTSFVAGAAVQADLFRSETLPAFDYSHVVPGAFAQVEHDLRPDLTLAGSTRLDFHSDYGTRLSPRLSLLYRPGDWTFRASYGRGFYAPTPFVDETDAAGLSRLEPLAGLRAETAETGSIDVGWRRGPWEANLTLFASDTDGASRLEATAPDRVRIVNSDGATRIRGSELLLRYRRDGLTLTGSYVYVDASEPNPDRPGRRLVPLTPRHSAGLVAIYERHGRFRVGAEAYYTGRQSLDDNPFRDEGRHYLELGLLGEVTLGSVRLFVNAENILDVRQTNYDPLVRPFRAPDGRWTVDAWAPTDGFVLNAGVRLKFGD